MDGMESHLISRPVLWPEKPRGRYEAVTTWHARITAIEKKKDGTWWATLELIAPCTGSAYAPIRELIDAEDGEPMSLQPTTLPPPPAPGSGAPPRYKPKPIDPDDLFSRLPRRLSPLPEPRFHVPTAPIASPSKPPRDRAESDIEEARAWLRKRAPAIEGQRGRPHTYATVCAIMFGWELGEHDTLMLVSEWNTWCKPPWQSHELAAIVRHAAQHGSRHPTGFMRRGSRERKPRKEREPGKLRYLDTVSFGAPGDDATKE